MESQNLSSSGSTAMINPGTQPQSAVVEANSPKKSSSRLIKMFLLILVGIALLGGGMYLGSNFVPKPAVLSPSASPIVKVSPTSDETANWQVYVNNKNGYSIKYPAGYVIAADVYNPDPLDADSIVIQAGEVQFQKPAVRIQIEPITSENTWKNKPYTSLVQLAEYMYEDVRNNQGIQALSSTELQSTTFLKNPAYTFSYRGNGYQGFSTSALGYEGNYQIMLTQQDGIYYLLIYNDEDVLQKIFSTFQFTDKNAVIPLEWKTYTDPKYNYTLSYPPNWSVTPSPVEGTGGIASFAGSNQNEQFKIEIGYYNQYGNDSLKPGETLKEYLMRQLPPGEESNSVAEKILTIGNREALRQIIYPLHGDGDKTHGIFYVFASGSDVYFAEAYVNDQEKHLDFIEKILSTFTTHTP